MKSEMRSLSFISTLDYRIFLGKQWQRHYFPYSHLVFQSGKEILSGIHGMQQLQHMKVGSLCHSQPCTAIELVRELFLMASLSIAPSLSQVLPFREASESWQHCTLPVLTLPSDLCALFCSARVHHHCHQYIWEARASRTTWWT
mmetsp:Transcript_4621/g.15401  ORF Transcript_4621/g.15401 Transcript_4621/m.15401 type:complete len:144 (-) Transcript_4621:59-490(-)